MAKNPFYVYILKDPRQKPAKPFYVGKGTGTRMSSHLINVDDSEKGKVIQAIEDQGMEVIATIAADDLTEEQALKIEAELISAFGILSQGGLLTNSVRPNPDNIKKKVRINIPDGCYERAQMGLQFIKAAVFELAKANPDGVTNSDVSKYLGLQSDYGGGSKDYLSYSILGLLMKERMLMRTGDKKHKLIRH